MLILSSSPFTLVLVTGYVPCFMISWCFTFALVAARAWIFLPLSLSLLVCVLLYATRTDPERRKAQRDGLHGHFSLSRLCLRESLYLESIPVPRSYQFCTAPVRLKSSARIYSVFSIRALNYTGVSLDFIFISYLSLFIPSHANSLQSFDVLSNTSIKSILLKNMV